MMRVAFISRASMKGLPGGDTVQMRATAAALQRMDVQVRIFGADESIPYNEFDLLHFFNIIRPADILAHQQRSGLPNLISTIFVEYHEYDRTLRGGMSGKLARVLGPHQMEYLKVAGRRLRNAERIQSPIYWVIGHRNAMKKAAQNAQLLLPNSQSEYQRFARAMQRQYPYQIVTNGVDPELFGQQPTLPRKSNTLLCVAKIEGIKNQLNLIKALANTNIQLRLIGQPVPNQPEYLQRCKQAATSNITFVPQMPQQQLLHEYATAKAHILPSWFETTGLSTLEAGALGCNVVITRKGDAHEYLGDFAHYCDPASPESIREAAQRALNAPENPALREKILLQHTWQVAAQQTLEAYHQVLASA